MTNSRLRGCIRIESACFLIDCVWRRGFSLAWLKPRPCPQLQTQQAPLASPDGNLCQPITGRSKNGYQCYVVCQL